jgi:acetate---CoA ligase (ADP-forming)
MSESAIAEVIRVPDRGRRSGIERLLKPKSVAIAGISSKPGSLAAIVLENLRGFGFAGDIHLIHPTQPELHGLRCVRSAWDLPDGIDCVVLAIPVSGVLDAVKGCAARGVGGVIIFSAGFAETGPEGRAVQDEIAAIAHAHDMAIEGPNCLGFVNYVDGIPLTFAATDPSPLAGQGIAVVSQSGAMAAAIRAALHSHDLGVSMSVSTGNEAATGVEDFIEFLLSFPQTRAIALVVEHIRNPRRFLDLARQARERGIVLLMLHPGRSLAARASAQTHTGALAGDYEVMRTEVEREGVLVVETLEELVDLADCVIRCAKRPFGGVAVLGESGAYKALTLDYCETLGLSLPQPEGAAAAALNSIAPGLIVSSNPLDLTAQGLVEPGLYGRALDHLMAHPDCGSLLVTIILSSPQMAARKMPPVIEAMHRWSDMRTVVFAMLGEDTPVPAEIVRAVRASGVPFFRSPERALRALARFTAWANTTHRAETSAPPRMSERLPSGIIPEYAAKNVLAAAGLPMPERCLVTDIEAALAAARKIGFPVALKAQSPALPHKSDVGGVILNLVDDIALRAGWERLHANLAASASGVPIDGILVEAMSKPGLELILGARRDPDWGPVLAIGLGGVLTELLRDVRLLSVDLTIPEIKQALRNLKGAALLDGFRGEPPRDVDALAATIAKLAAFMRAHPEVREIDINPLVAFREGEGVVALDALMSCK